jgi:gamma-glutamyl-gamma-aminobutyrate hydrolase PuuD
MSVKIEKKSRPKVYVVGGGFDYIRLLYGLGYDGAKGVAEADIVLFTGGEDVNPELYGEPCMRATNFCCQRDDYDVGLFKQALSLELPMVGVCRGGQFLNVMNGGKMWQHVTKHCQDHLIRVEIPPFNNDKRRSIMATSTHHQMMIPTEEALILATAAQSDEKISPKYTRSGVEDNDCEVCFYDETNCLCFQPHPEYARATADCVDFFEECLANFIVPRISIPPLPKKILDKIKPSKKEKV